MSAACAPRPTRSPRSAFACSPPTEPWPATPSAAAPSASASPTASPSPPPSAPAPISPPSTGACAARCGPRVCGSRPPWREPGLRPHPTLTPPHCGQCRMRPIRAFEGQLFAQPRSARARSRPRIASLPQRRLGRRHAPRLPVLGRPRRRPPAARSSTAPEGEISSRLLSRSRPRSATGRRRRGFPPTAQSTDGRVVRR